MRDYSRDFDLSPDHVWLNAASEGPLPKAAAQALQEALSWKMSPHLLTVPKFHQLPLELKKAIARLIQVDAADIVLGNSTTYGVHLLANGLPLRAGDGVLVMQNDFPSDILPWLPLQRRGINVCQVPAQGAVLTPAEVQAALTPATRVVCLPHIHSFSGQVLDVAAIGQLCRRYGILFIVNMSQSIGSIAVQVGDLPVDAVVCAGYKWLLGPYATGFCWMRPEVREQLDYPQAYWIALMDERSLVETGDMRLPEAKTSRRFDVFATANFFNYVPWKASIEYLQEIGLARIEGHNQLLLRQIREGLDPSRFECAVSGQAGETPNMVVFSARQRGNNNLLADYLKDNGLHVALWKGNLRVSPHIYNTQEDIARLVAALKRYEFK